MSDTMANISWYGMEDAPKKRDLLLAYRYQDGSGRTQTNTAIGGWRPARYNRSKKAYDNGWVVGVSYEVDAYAWAEKPSAPDAKLFAKGDGGA